MWDHVTEELISAYLDGELSDDERELVDRAVAESEEHRQLLAELRALHGSLQTLPRFSAPADFSARVLQQIEQSKSAPKVASRHGVVLGRRRALRNLTAAAASLAAIIVIAILLRPASNQPVGPIPSHPTVAVPAWLNKPPQMVTVYDVTVTAKGEKNHVFENVLKALGIVVDPNLKLNGKLENDLLAIRQRAIGLRGTKTVPYKQDEQTPKSGKRDQVELIYISSKVGPLMHLGLRLEQLRNAGDEVSRMHYDLVFEEQKMKVIRRLHESAVHEFATAGDSSSNVNGYAFKLVSATSQSQFTLPSLSEDAGLNEHSPGGPAASLAPGGASVDRNAPATKDGGAEGAGELVGRRKHVETDNDPAHVLIILRKVADKP